MKRQALYQVAENGKITCLLCPRECKLSEGQKGSCHTRKVVDGKLQTISYGNPCSIHVDPVEKKPLFHYYPGSNTFSFGVAGCVLHCQNCQNYTISQTSPSEVPGFPFPAETIIKECKASGCDSISYTYSEPFAFYEYMADVAILARREGLKNILVTSAYVNEQPLRDILPYIDAANVDIKCFSNEVYKKLCDGTLEPVLRNLKILRESNVWVEITNLIVPGWSDDFEHIEYMCQWLVNNGFAGNPLHFSRFFPLYKLKDLSPTPVETIERAVAIAKASGLKYVYAGNVQGNANINTVCPDCRATLISREGFNVSVHAGFAGVCPSCGTKIEGYFEKG